MGWVGRERVLWGWGGGAGAVGLGRWGEAVRHHEKMVNGAACESKPQISEIAAFM